MAAIFDVALTSGRDLAAFAFAASVFAGIALAITAVFFAKPDFRGADPAFVTLVASWSLADTDFPAAGFACRSLAPPDLLGDTLDLDTD
ncbi:MAG: hypothetical protein IID61_02020 [SAR324 cluster bacterium]|nr:hypothetical protein [SAR324 cluster bacterium]